MPPGTSWRQLKVPLMLVSLAFAACASGQRHRVLSFLFDGVPDPNAPTTTTLPTHRKRPYLLPHRPAQPIVVPAALPYVSKHKPFGDRQCSGCHDLSSGNDTMTRTVMLCDRCHQEQRVREKWGHGPINLGMCTPCHKAHQSPYPHLLEEPVPDLCQRCHEDVLEQRPAYHQIPELNQCTRCHDPHRGTTFKADAS